MNLSDHSCRDCFFHNEQSWLCSNGHSPHRDACIDPRNICREWMGWKREEGDAADRKDCNDGTCSFCIYHDGPSGICANGLSDYRGEQTGPTHFCDEYVSPKEDGSWES